MSVLHKAVYKFNAILSKFQWHFSIEIGKTIPNLYENCQKTPESQSNFVKEQSWGNHISWFQTLWQSYSNQNSSELPHESTVCPSLQSMNWSPSQTSCMPEIHGHLDMGPVLKRAFKLSRVRQANQLSGYYGVYVRDMRDLNTMCFEAQQRNELKKVGCRKESVVFPENMN